MEFVDGRDVYQLMVQNAEDNVDVPFDIAAFIGLKWLRVYITRITRQIAIAAP